MQEKIELLTRGVVAYKRWTLGMLIGMTIVGGTALAMNTSDTNSHATNNVAMNDAPDIAIAIAGATSTWSDIETGNSWPGELVSLGNVPVQPSREGMIAEWRVHVGERVLAGQVLGTLSAPPQMPDTLAMLADEEKMATMARVNAEAKRAYAAERLPQLEALRANIERSLASSQDILSGNKDAASALSMIEAKKATIRAILRGSLVRTYPIMSGQSVLPSRWGAITLKAEIGAQDSRLRDKFQQVISAALAGINDTDNIPTVSGLAYFDLAIRLADASLPDGNMLTDTELAMLKETLHEDQETFIMAIDKLRETELMAVDTQKMAFEQLKMIDNDIAMLKQDLTMAEGDVTAKEASARTVKNAVSGGAAIVAPKSGTVSVIMKKTGEYVMPGTPVAIVTGGNGNDLIVRFRVPVNVQKPTVGEMLAVVRTGFPDAPRMATLIGVGSALDEGGAIMADAALSNASDWTVGAAVRVLAPSKNDAITIKLSSLWWDAEGQPNVWAVSDAGRVYAKKIVQGKTIGELVEVTDGLLRGERYVEKPIPTISEDMLVDDISSSQKNGAGGSSYEEAMRAMGHDM